MARKRRRSYPARTESSTALREGPEYGKRGEMQGKPEEQKGKKGK